MSMTRLSIDSLLTEVARDHAESWRYSRNAVRALSRQNFVDTQTRAEPDAATLAAVDLAATRGQRIVFVNGRYSARHSDDATLRDPTCGVAVTHADDGGIVLDFRDDVAAPVHVVHVNASLADASLWQTACQVHVCRDVSATLIEQHVGQGAVDVFGKLVSEMRLDSRARLHAICLTDLADSTSLYRRARCRVGEGAGLTITQAHAGGRLQRLECSIDLAGREAACETRGLFTLRGRQHVDVNLDVRHDARDTRSEVFWRGVADQRAHGILHGGITVGEGADGADAQLQTKNLLLSPHAEIDAQPVLEIYADEVKAAHGATVGQLDEQAMFYLRTRGIDPVQAREMLIDAFCGEVYAGIDDKQLHSRFAALLADRQEIAP